MRRTYQLLYRLRLTPWADRDIPAALKAIVIGPAALTPGVAVDLGCGTGEHARYLAGLGWSTTAVDFVATAIATARRRDRTGLVTWRVADVTQPDQVDPDGALRGVVSLLLDVGCLHGLSPAQRSGWATTVANLAAPTATLLLRAAPPARRGIGPAGIGVEQITALLRNDWHLNDRHGGWYRYDISPKWTSASSRS
jgi:hypothetical protein